MSNITLGIDVDTTSAEAKIDTLQAKIDKQQQEWSLIRQETLAQMNHIARGISITIQAVRTAAKVTGQTLSPLFNSLLALVSSTTSLVIATATLLAASSIGVLAGVAVAISVAAWTFQAVQTAKIVADSEEFKAMMSQVDTTLASLSLPSTYGGVL